MAFSYSVRPHLLDEDAIRTAILNTGLDAKERDLIADLLLENFTVDLDLLAAAFATLDSLSSPQVAMLDAA